MDARTTALSALIACRRQAAWSDGVLKEYIARDALDGRDAAFASRLCYGVLQNRMLLDFYLAQKVRGARSKLQPVVLDILRLGAYQILFCDRVPDAAEVIEAVVQTNPYATLTPTGQLNRVNRAAGGACRRRHAGNAAARLLRRSGRQELCRRPADAERGQHYLV